MQPLQQSWKRQNQNAMNFTTRRLFVYDKSAFKLSRAYLLCILNNIVGPNNWQVLVSFQKQKSAYHMPEFQNKIIFWCKGTESQPFWLNLLKLEFVQFQGYCEISKDVMVLREYVEDNSQLLSHLSLAHL